MNRFPLYNKILCSLLGAVGFLALSCQEEQKEVGPTYDTGVLIYNAGTNAATGGTISYYDRATGTVTEPDLFNKVNGRALEGNVASWASGFEKTYLITSTQKIEVLQSRSLAASGEIRGIELPQKVVLHNNRVGYVSDWATPTDSGRVMVVNLFTNQVTDTIKVGLKPGAMVAVGTRLFVANSSGNKVNVLNTTTTRIDTTLTVGDNPSDMVVDASGFLWVLCKGKTNASSPSTNTQGQLIRFAPNNLRTRATVFTFPNSNVQPHSLSVSTSRNRLYFISDGVYVMDIGATSLPTVPLIRRQFQALAQDPTDGILYASKVPANAPNGWVIRYRNTGAVIDSFQVTGAPIGFSFR